MNSGILQHIIRAFILILLQVLVFKNIQTSGFIIEHISLIIYPIIIIFLPLGINNNYILLIGFILGLVVDTFYNSPGIHASALVLLAFLRPVFLKAFQPAVGYRANDTLNIKSQGLPWVLYYGGFMLFTFILYYFSVEAFSLVYIIDILANTIMTFIPSYILMLMYFYLFNPKY